MISLRCLIYHIRRVYYSRRWMANVLVVEYVSANVECYFIHIWLLIFKADNLENCCIVTINYTYNTYAHIHTYTQKHSQYNNDERTQLFSKIYLSNFIRNGCERVRCERWVGDETKTATYWPPVPLAIAALLSRSARLLNRGPWGPSSQKRAGSHCLELQQLTFLLHRVIPLFDVNLLPVSVTFAPNSTRPRSRLYPDIFDRLHLFIDWSLDQYVTKIVGIFVVTFLDPKLSVLLLCCSYL